MFAAGGQPDNAISAAIARITVLIPLSPADPGALLLARGFAGWPVRMTLAKQRGLQNRLRR
jgi:hypothetical protein